MLSTSAVHLEPDTRSLQSYRGGVTILLVDDDPTVLTLLRAVLSHEGYRVITAASPSIAMEVAVRHPFDMLITDFQMPESNGFVLASRLAQNRSSLPVLVLSGSQISDLPLGDIAESHWNFMSKPIDKERLLRIIDGECLGPAMQRRA